MLTENGEVQVLQPLVYVKISVIVDGFIFAACAEQVHVYPHGKLDNSFWSVHDPDLYVHGRCGVCSCWEENVT